MPYMSFAKLSIYMIDICLVYSVMVVLWLLDIPGGVRDVVRAQIVVCAYTGRYAITLKGQQFF